MKDCTNHGAWKLAKWAIIPLAPPPFIFSDRVRALSKIRSTTRYSPHQFASGRASLQQSNSLHGDARPARQKSGRLLLCANEWQVCEGIRALCDFGQRRARVSLHTYCLRNIGLCIRRMSVTEEKDEGG